MDAWGSTVNNDSHNDIIKTIAKMLISVSN